MSRRFVLRYSGSGRAPEADVGRIQAHARIVDRSSRMLLVEGEVSSVRDLVSELRGWVASEESPVTLPDTRQRPLR